jgi:hypothetical protein
MPSDDEPTFGVIRMRGGRYNRPGLPLEAAPELHRYESLVVRVARALYMRQNPRRKRAPRAFSTSMLLRLTAIKDGSVIPVLERDEAMLQDKLSAPLLDYFEQARLLINTTLADIANNNSLNSSFPPECLKDLGSLGRSLRGDERIEFANREDESGIVFDQTVRNSLQALARIDQLDIEVVLLGQITGLRSTPQQFDFVISDTGRRIVGNYFDPAMWADLNNFVGFAERAPMVSIAVVAQQSIDGVVLGVSDVLSVEAALPPEWAERVQWLANLNAGWLDGSGDRPNEAALTRLEQILLGCVDEQISRPGIFPTESQGVLLEWTTSEAEVEVEIDSEGSIRTLWFSKALDEERELSFGNKSSVDEIVTFIQEALR